MTRKWPTVQLGDVLTRSDEILHLQPDMQYREITIRLWGKGVVLRGLVTGVQVVAQRRYVARKGQFILSRIDARNGALGLVPGELDGAIVSNDFPIFDLDHNKLLPAYLGWISRTASFVEDCQHASEGTTNRVRLQEDKFFRIQIPLPPMEEQRRTVAKIEELADQINEARTLRQQTKEEVEVIRLSWLRSAIQNCEAEETELQDVCEEIIDNLHSNPRYSENGIPCVRSPDVGWGILNLDTALKTDEEEYRRRTIRGRPRPDDIVFVREGGGTGKAAIVLRNQCFSLGQRVMMLRPDRQKVLPQFLLYQILSPLIQKDQIVPLCKGSASPHLNIGALRHFRFRLPSLPEQRRIVKKLDDLQRKVSSVTALQAETATELDALLPSILDRAFKGEL